jgi:hypothetical protein
MPTVFPSKVRIKIKSIGEKYSRGQKGHWVQVKGGTKKKKKKT